MSMKAKQAEKLEEQDAEEAEELAALQEDMELPLSLKAGGHIEGFLIQLMNVGFGYRTHARALTSDYSAALTGPAFGPLYGQRGRVASCCSRGRS